MTKNVTYGRSGIYKIQNLVNNKLYVGSSNNIGKRWNWHKNRLYNGNHNNRYLQRSVVKYGLNNFKFEVIELCEKEMLLVREQYYIDSIKPYYNLHKLAGSPKGFKMIQIHKDNISKALIGRERTKIHSENLSKSLKFIGHKPCRQAVLNSVKVRQKQVIVSVGGFSKIFENVAEVIKIYGLENYNRRTINNVCAKKGTICGLNLQYA